MSITDRLIDPLACNTYDEARSLTLEAATEITRLRAERDDLLKANALLHSLLTTARGERDALRAALRKLDAQSVATGEPTMVAVPARLLADAIVRDRASEQTVTEPK